MTLKVYNASATELDDPSLNNSWRNLESRQTYHVKYVLPSGLALSIRNLNMTANTTINPQFVATYSGMMPSSTTTGSYAIALNTTGLSFDYVEITLPLSSSAANRILHCTDWNYATALCSSWESNPTSSYTGIFNSTHFVFNVTSFDAYMAGVYTAPATSSSPAATTASVSGGNSGGSGFNYLPVQPDHGKLSISSYPAYMTAEQGQQVSYTFTLKNVGNATLHDVKVAIKGINLGWFSLEPGTVRTVSELKADEEQIFTLKVRLPADAVPQTYRLTLNATSDDNSVNAVSSVFEVLEKAKAEPISSIVAASVVAASANKVKPEVKVQAGGLTPAMVTELPSDLTPTGKGVAFSLYGGSSLLLLGIARRSRRMHKLHAAHLMTAHRSGRGKKQ